MKTGNGSSDPWRETGEKDRTGVPSRQVDWRGRKKASKNSGDGKTKSEGSVRYTGPLLLREAKQLSTTLLSKSLKGKKSGPKKWRESGKGIVTRIVPRERR